MKRPLALQLRIEGLSYAEIGRRLGIAEKNAWKHVQNALHECAELEQERADTLRQIQAARLDRMLGGLWKPIEKGNPKAVTAAVAIERRRADLFGLDAPEKSEIAIKSLDTVLAAVLAVFRQYVQAERIEDAIAEFGRMIDVVTEKRDELPALPPPVAEAHA